MQGRGRTILGYVVAALNRNRLDAGYENRGQASLKRLLAVSCGRDRRMFDLVRLAVGPRDPSARVGARDRKRT